MITVTLQQIKNAGPCEYGWKKVLKANGGINADFDKPFSLVSILDSNDLEDTLWVLDNVSEMEEYDDVIIQFRCFCGLQNIEEIKPYCSVEDYDLIVQWLETQDESIRKAAYAAAFSVWSVESAAWSARYAARSAAESAVESTAWSARYAAWSARYAVESARYAVESARSEQEEKLRELIGWMSNIMSNETRPRMLQTSWHKVKLAMEKTGIKDRNEAIQAVADGYMNAASEIEDEREVSGEAFDKLVKAHNKKIRTYKKENQSLATCLAISISSGFVLFGILGSVKGWW